MHERMHQLLSVSTAMAEGGGGQKTLANSPQPCNTVQTTQSTYCQHSTEASCRKKRGDASFRRKLEKKFQRFVQ